jgi:hypothetical protein
MHTPIVPALDPIFWMATVAGCLFISRWLR